MDLYQEKLALEETLIRENAQHKMQNRMPQKQMGPPITFASPVIKQPSSSKDIGASGDGREETKGGEAGADGLTEN